MRVCVCLRARADGPNAVGQAQPLRAAPSAAPSDAGAGGGNASPRSYVSSVRQSVSLPHPPSSPLTSSHPSLRLYTIPFALRPLIVRQSASLPDPTLPSPEAFSRFDCPQFPPPPHPSFTAAAAVLFLSLLRVLRMQMRNMIVL